MSTKTLYCFVCDTAVTNRYFSLATCRTQSSKKKLVEKLGYLVGDQYMIVITEDDVICRSCANLMNTLDRLEVEMGSVKRVVLRFLERKYSLEEGELLNQKGENQSQETEKNTSSSFMVRKKQSEQELDELNIECSAEDPRSRIWMQCDTCQYTTNYTSFVKNHIRDEICLDCEAPTKNGMCTEDCVNKSKPECNPVQETSVKTDSDAMELIVNNMNFLNGENDETFSLISDPNIQGKLEVAFNVNESGEMSLTEDKPDEREEKPALYLQVVDEDDDDFENSNVRQVLTVTGDGAVEMMEVMWNEETNSPVAEIPF
ncbi:hypothetical protein RUM44_009366 [Polyplax serrata]|uniref:ZAD domain-containing protein n=1 Tax=Polyplax serrata TaxID=468196 RepID=A0ABR1ASH9_POLSC